MFFGTIIHLRNGIFSQIIFLSKEKEHVTICMSFSFISKSGEIFYEPQFISFSLKSDGEQLIPKHIIIIL